MEQPSNQRFSQLSSENNLAVLSKFPCIMVGILTIIYHCTFEFGGNLFVLYPVFNHDSNTFNLAISYKNMCNIISTSAFVIFGLGNGWVYLFLWFRHRVFYAHLSLNTLNSKVTKGFSASILVIFAI